MKKVVVLFLFFVSGLNFLASAQDVIFKTDGSREQAKITMISDRVVEYKKFSNPEGPVFSVNKADILMITYENGDYESFKKPEKPVKVDFTVDFCRNVFAYHLFALVFNDFTISYEHIFPSGKIGLQIPVSFGYDNFNSDYNFSNVFYSGVGVNFYPNGQGKWRYFMGPQLRLGLGKDGDYMYYYDEYGNYISDGYVSNEGFYGKFFIDNGVVFLPVRNFSISAIGSIGIRYFPEANHSDYVVRTDGYFAINLGYRF